MYGSIKVEVIKYIAKLHYFIMKSIFSINYSKSYKISHKIFKQHQFNHTQNKLYKIHYF